MVHQNKFLENLHPFTRDVLSKIADFKGPQFLPTHKRWRSFNENPNRKKLEKLVHAVHFNLLNERPEHIEVLRKFPSELAKFWPYELHGSIIQMEHPELESQKVLWTRNNEKALGMLKFERHSWLQKKQWEQINVENVKQLTGIEGDLNVGLQSDFYRLSKDMREHTLRRVFEQFMFLKKHPKVSETKKLPVPIVEIGLKPDGLEIPDVRIDNLFKDRITEVASILVEQNPVLSEQAELTLKKIITDPSINRPVRRLYQKVCMRAYVLKNDQFSLSELARGSYSSHLVFPDGPPDDSSVQSTDASSCP